MKKKQHMDFSITGVQPLCYEFEAKSVACDDTQSYLIIKSLEDWLREELEEFFETSNLDSENSLQPCLYVRPIEVLYMVLNLETRWQLIVNNREPR